MKLLQLKTPFTLNTGLVEPLKGSIVIALLLATHACLATDQPKPKDFAEGMILTATGSQPLLELAIPDRVYATITQWNDADLRVFNADGNAVPYAFCSVAAPAPQPTWYSAGAPYGTDDIRELRYENTRRAPVSLLRITPRVENSSVHITVQSRDRDDHAWQTQWTGEVFDIHFNDQTRHNEPIAITATAARDWRLLFADNEEPPASAPEFELGYFPLHLRFLAQGIAPYILAYGNARLTTVSAQQCDQLISSITYADKQQLIGTVNISAVQIYAGKDALTVKKIIPARTLVLWGILLIGVAFIMKLAFSMLKSSKRHDKD